MQILYDPRNSWTRASGKRIIEGGKGRDVCQTVWYRLYYSTSSVNGQREKATMLGVDYITPSIASLKGSAGPSLGPVASGGLGILRYSRAADRKPVVPVYTSLRAERAPIEASAVHHASLRSLAPRAAAHVERMGVLPAYPRTTHGNNPRDIGDATLQRATVPMPEPVAAKTYGRQMTELLYQRAGDVARAVVPEHDIAAGLGVDHRGAPAVANRWRAPPQTKSQVAMQTMKVQLALRGRRAH